MKALARRSYRPLLIVAAALAATALVVVSQSGRHADTGPMLVTTDTLAYCDALADRLDTLRATRPNADPEVARLAAVGRQMCSGGLIRGGLIRLRRGLLLLQQAQK